MANTLQQRVSKIPLAAASTALMFLVALASAQAQTLTVLYDFGGRAGENPYAGLVRDAAGNLYGTTYQGGAYQCGTVPCGTVFKVSRTGRETVLHRFAGSADGANPYAGLVLDAAGNLYGTTPYGGSSGYGTVFKVGKTGTETVLYSFTGGADGAYPLGSLLMDATGNLYGTTEEGGAFGMGTVFEVNTSGTETVLYSFAGGSTDGAYPSAGLLRDPAGNLFGTTPYGGSSGYGTVFELNTSGTETVVYSFTGKSDGANPYAGLIRDAAGNLYGTTYQGGSSGHGTVFKMSTTGTETVLHSFAGGSSDGEYPYSALVRDSRGNLYGTTILGGNTVCYGGCGTVFRVRSNGRETVLHYFESTDGQNPYAGLVRDPGGNFYGTTSRGGSSGHGTTWKLTP